VLKAFLAAKGYLTGRFPTLAIAANACGACPAYVAAAIVILKANDATLRNEVLDGIVPLLAAAKLIKQAVKLVEAFHASSATERVRFAQTVGPEVLFDTVTAAL
jgi:hypothetical protein